MITNTKVFGNHLDRDVNDIFFDSFAGTPTRYDSIAKIMNAPAGDHYTEAELSPLGNLRDLPQGTGIQFDNPVEGNKKTIYYNQYGLGFQITKQMYRDDLTGNFKRMPEKLAKSAALKPEVVFFDLFNNGFTSELASDGQYVFDTDHVTLKSGETVANKPGVAGSLSETTLQAGFEYFDGVPDEAGNPLDFEPYLLVTNVGNRWIARRLNMQEFEPASPNRDVNLLNPSYSEVGSWQVLLSKYITSTTAWFLLSRQHDFRLYWKEKSTLESADDFYSGNALFKVTNEFGVAVFNYKGAYGNAGA
jgi:hypothetical protein